VAAIRQDPRLRNLDSEVQRLQASHALAYEIKSLDLQDETSFLYHFSDIHGLKISSHTSKCWQQRRSSTDFINRTSYIASQKRKSLGSNGQDRGSSKRNKDFSKIDWSNNLSFYYSLDEEASHKTQTMPSHMMSKVPFIDLSAGGSPQDLPKLTYSGPSSPPDSDDFYLIEDFDPCKTIYQMEVSDKAERSIDFGEKKDPVADEDALFSQYLRSRSPSCSSVKGNNDDTRDGSIHFSPTGNTSNICLFASEALPDSTDHNSIESRSAPPKVRKPRITLRLRQPVPRPKPKVSLRLSQPKRAPAPRSVH